MILLIYYIKIRYFKGRFCTNDRTPAGFDRTPAGFDRTPAGFDRTGVLYGKSCQSEHLIPVFAEHAIPV